VFAHLNGTYEDSFEGIGHDEEKEKRLIALENPASPSGLASF